MNQRPHIAELLDVGGAPPEEIARSFADLRRINRWLGGRQVLLDILGAEVSRGRLTAFSLLDVGAGRGDLGAAVAETFPTARVVLCDLKSEHLPRNGAARLAASAAALPFPDSAFDFVAASLLLHHFTDTAAVGLLRDFGCLARRAVLINDLERHWFPRRFLRLSAPLFARSPITRHDGDASIRQAFLPEELGALALAAGFRDFAVRRHPPWFRLSLVIRTGHV